MKPELIENPTFLRYYEKWQNDPTSVVFAAISEIFRSNGLIDDAIKIATAGLKHHPDLVSGHLALAKALIAKGEKAAAREHAMIVLGRMPKNIEARQIVDSLEPAFFVAPKLELMPEGFEEEDITEDMPLASIKIKDDEELEVEMEKYSKLHAEPADDEGSVSDHEAWYTVTMARILAGQGHTERAKKVYKAILNREPQNETAQKELDNL